MSTYPLQCYEKLYISLHIQECSVNTKHLHYVTYGHECQRMKLDKMEKYKHTHSTHDNIAQNIKYADLQTAKDMQSICI
jgi:hypothetical protein